MSNECKEFNNLKYRTMITTGTNIETNNVTSEETINNFLNMDIENNADTFKSVNYITENN